MPERGDLPLEHRRGVKVRERRRRRRVGVVVGGHVDGLHRGDRAALGRGDALLELAHFGGERRLVTDGAGDPAEKRRHFRTCLGKAEDVVDEQKHVLVFFVAEVFGDRERGERHAGTGSRRFVHLAVDQRGFRENARFLHLVEKVVALAGALTHSGEHGEAPVLGSDIVDQLLDTNGLADAGAAEEADLAALQVGRHEVDDLDAGLEDLRLGLQVLELGRAAVNRIGFLGVDWAGFVDGIAGDVEDAAEHFAADRHGNLAAGVLDGRMPRARPSVASMEMVRTTFSPRCCATSSVRLSGLLLIAALVTRRAL